MRLCLCYGGDSVRIEVNMPLIWEVSTYYQEKFNPEELEKLLNFSIDYVTVDRSFLTFRNESDATVFLLRWG